MKNMAKFSKSIGIIGGAGPMASAFLYTSILHVCGQKYNANDYADFPEILLVSYPFTRGNEKKIRTEITECLAKLKKIGASLFCVASHSFHSFLPSTLPTGFVSLVSETLREAKRLKISTALVLASETTIRSSLYEQPGIICVYPPASDQLLVNQLIREVAGGEVNKTQSKKLISMISRLRKTLSFDGVLIACTELPLIHAQFPIALHALPMVDAIQILSGVLVEKSLKNLK